MINPVVQAEALIEAQKRAGIERTRIQVAENMDRKAKLNRLDRIRFEEYIDRLHRDEQSDEAKRIVQEAKIHRKECAEKLAVNIDRHNCLLRHDETMRKMVRFNTEELRELEFKLRSAVVGRGIKAQLEERQAEKLQEKIEEQKRLQTMLEQVKLDKEQDRQKKQADFDKRLALRAVLQDQMAIKTMQNQRLYEEFLREKKLIDDTIQQIYEERLAHLRETNLTKLRYRHDLQQLAEVQEAMRLQEKREIAEEDARIAAYLVERNAAEDARRKAESTRKENTSQLADQMCLKLLEDEKKRVERIELLHILRGEELEQIAAEKLRSEMERKVRRRLETVIEMHEQRAEREQRRRREQEDDREFRRRQLEDLAARDKIEQLSNERRRQKIVEHNRIVQQLLAKRRNQNAEELMRKLDERQEQDRAGAKLKQIIEEERIKILQEYATTLGGVFPRGVLRENDRQKLNL